MAYSINVLRSKPKNYCLLCNSYNLKLVFNEEKNKSKSSNYSCSAAAEINYKPPIVRCNDCRAIQIPISSIPNNLDKIYGDVIDKDYINNFTAKTKTFNEALKKLKKYIINLNKMSILEVGSYCGAFLDVLKDNGFSYFGIEPSSWAYNISKKRHKNVKNIFFDSKVKMHRKFDLICTWDVLEHILNPEDFIQTLSKHLNDNGYIALSTIDGDSLFARICGHKWKWIMPMHLHYFGKNVVHDIFIRNNFSKIHVGNYTHYAKVSYIAKSILPNGYLLNLFLNILQKFHLDLIIPVSLGDIKIYIYQKKAKHNESK